jgi:ABC-type multidrug transport system fused ATPase/permease subunit
MIFKIFKNIIQEYFEKNKINVVLYIFVCSLDNIIRVLITSKVYSSFLNINSNLVNTLKNIILVWILKFLLSYCKSYLESIIIPGVMFYIRNRLVSDYIKTNEIDFNDVDISNDFRQIMESVKLLGDIIVWVSESVIPFIILVIFMNGYFLIKYPKVGAINIIGTILSLYVIKNDYKYIVKRTSNREDFFMKMTDHIDQSLNNMMNIFLNNKSNDTILNITELGETDSNNHKEIYTDLENFTTKVKMVNYIFSGLGLYSLYKCANKEDFVNGLLMYTFFIQIQETIIEEIPKHIIHISNLNYIEKYLQLKVYDRFSKNEKEYDVKVGNFKGNIDIKNVYFKYNIVDLHSFNNEEKSIDKKPAETSNVINNLNLSVKQGERLAIYAKSGSGKSTLMKLLLAFYKPQSGYILLDGKDINLINPINIRDRVNYINQKTILFQDSIINNMRYGNNKSPEEIIDFLKKYNLLYIFRDCDKSESTCLNSIIQGSGLNMSLGMQKVIFLVRGILKDSDVYIFDEPLTSLDSNTRKNVINMIDKEIKGKTVIIITHDNEIDKIVDRKINLLEIQDKVI